jgi:hypothetical protein
MVVVFSVNGALATYSIEFPSPEHVIARQAKGEKRKDIPEKLEFYKQSGEWTSDTENFSVKTSIIHALRQADNHK